MFVRFPTFIFHFGGMCVLRCVMRTDQFLDQLLCMRLVAVLQLAASILLVRDCREVAICGYHLFLLSLSHPRICGIPFPYFSVVQKMTSPTLVGSLFSLF